MLTIAIISTIIAKAQGAPMPVDNLLLDQGFTELKSFTRPATSLFGDRYGFTSMRSGGQTKLSVAVSMLKQDSGLKQAWREFQSGLAQAPPKESFFAPSNLPLGERVYFRGGDSMIVKTVSKEAAVTVSLRRLNSGPNSVSANTPVVGSDALLCESLARWALASAGAKAMAKQSLTLSQVKVGGLVSRSGVQLGNAREFAARKKLPYKLDEKTGVATIGTGPNEIVIPLGSAKIAVGKNWIDLPHIVVALGKDPYVSSAQLAKATSQGRAN